MKTLKYIPLLLISCLLFVGCLKKGLPEYEDWDLNIIQNVYVEHRYETDKLLNGEPVVGYQRLNVTKTVDELNNTIYIKIEVPAANGTFTSAIRDKVLQTNLWMYVDISTAASISPLNGSPKLGDPADLTKDHSYKVTAANGSEKKWVIKVSSFQK